jgi:hypothetical protein
VRMECECFRCDMNSRTVHLQVYHLQLALAGCIRILKQFVYFVSSGTNFRSDGTGRNNESDTNA